MKTLSNYAKAVGATAPKGFASVEIAEISNSSLAKSSKPWLFCAIPGAKRDGHDFVKDAIANGAAAAIVAKPVAGLPDGFPLLFVENTHKAWASACELRFGNPAAKLSLSGVTGTNGKTTIAFILKKALESDAGCKCGLLSTVFYDAGAGLLQDAARTTPDAYDLQRVLAQCVVNGCSHAVLEASSHGLHQGRLGSIKLQAALFTNLTGDHLDYHHDMESYYQAKKLLFTEHLAPRGVAIVNIDDSYGARLHWELAKSLDSSRLVACSKSSAKAQCRIKALHLSDTSSELELSVFGHILKIKSRLIGEHNACNLSMAAAAAISLGSEPELVAEALACPIMVPGRLECFVLPSGALAFVDYAHTDDALFRVLSALRPLCRGSLVTVFGCGGDRDVTKRPRMGAVAARFSERCIITNDNPRSEDPLEIIAQIRKGIPHGSRCLEIPDRRAAIETAIANAECGDIILVAGKGHESYQEANGKRVHFDDREVLASLGAVPRATA